MIGISDCQSSCRLEFLTQIRENLQQGLTSNSAQPVTFSKCLPRRSYPLESLLSLGFKLLLNQLCTNVNKWSLRSLSVKPMSA